MNMSSPFQKLSLAGLMLVALSLPISFVPAEFGIGLALLGWMLEGLIRKNWQIQRHPILWILLFYVAWNIVAAVISPRPLHSLWAVADNEWGLLIMVMMFWTVRDEQTAVNLAYFFIATSTLNVFYGLWQSISGVELYRGMPLDRSLGVFRPVGFQGFYLTYAAYAMAAFFLSSSLGLVLHGKLRTWMRLISVLSFLAVIATFARSIWLAFAVTIPAFGFLRSKKTGWIVSGTFVGLLLVGFVFFQPIRSRVETIFELEKNQTRLNLWKTSLNMSRDFLLTGVGADNFDYYFEQYRAEGFYDTTVHPHNDYLNVLVSSGIPGLAAFIALWMLTLREGYKASVRGKVERLRAIAFGGMLSIAGFLVGAFFQDYYGTFSNCLEWWFLTGLVFTSSKLIGRNPDQ